MNVNWAAPLGNFKNICRMIKIEHSVFALPYAWAGAFMAARGLPGLWELFFLTLAMVAIRSFAMAFNRAVDLPYDSRNPRTQKRPLVTGEISLAQTWFFCFVMAVVFIASCAALNPLCLLLALPTLLFAALYSLVKRFSWLCHFWLGATLGLAPVAGWISVMPEVTLTPILFFWAVTFWVASFDILYSCQDVNFDREQKLFSVPACFGISCALRIAAFSHVLVPIFLCLGGWSLGLSWPWYAVCALIALVLFWEHRLVKEDDLSRINMAFFTLNGAISIVMFIGVLLGIYL